MNWLYELFGTILKFIYEFTGKNFGVALIIFTVLMKIALLPLGIKQQRSMMAMQKLQPKLNELQKKYANDKEKLSRETMELYKKNNASPFGGCLPMIFQLILLLAMVNIVYRPATYLMGLEGVSKDLGAQIVAAKEAGMDFKFLFWDLAERPQFGFVFTVPMLITWALPVLATVATYLSGVLTQKMSGQPAGGQQNEQAQQMTKSMTTFMPIMTLVLTFTMPMSAALYWAISSFAQVFQQWILTKILKVNVEDEGGLTYHDKLNQKRKKH